MTKVSHGKIKREKENQGPKEGHICYRFKEPKKERRKKKSPCGWSISRRKWYETVCSVHSCLKLQERSRSRCIFLSGFGPCPLLSQELSLLMDYICLLYIPLNLTSLFHQHLNMLMTLIS